MSFGMSKPAAVAPFAVFSESPDFQLVQLQDLVWIRQGYRAASSANLGPAFNLLTLHSVKGYKGLPSLPSTFFFSVGGTCLPGGDVLRAPSALYELQQLSTGWLSLASLERQGGTLWDAHGASPRRFVAQGLLLHKVCNSHIAEGVRGPLSCGLKTSVAASAEAHPILS